MILSAKIGSSQRREYVNHINGNTLDNTLDNFEKLSLINKNVKHAVENGIMCKVKNGINPEVLKKRTFC